MIAHYYYIKDNERHGPYSYEELLQLGLAKDVLVWRDGLSEWMPLTMVENLMNEQKESTPPPLPKWIQKPTQPQKRKYRIRRFLQQYDKKTIFVASCVFIGLIICAVIILRPLFADEEVSEPVSTKLVQRKVDKFAHVTEVSKLRTFSAQLNGVITHLDPSVKSMRFKYSDGTIVKYSPISGNLQSGEVHCTIDYLTPNTPYAFCIETESDNTFYESSWQTFITLPRPQPITITNAKRHKRTGSLLNAKSLKGKKKQLIEACNYQDSTINALAHEIFPANRKDFNLGHICDLFDYCFDNWKYDEEPRRRDPYQSASTTIENHFTGNSDDFAILLCSLLLSIGGDARINTTITEEGEHTYTEINLGYINLKEANEYLSRRYANCYSGSVNYRVDQYGHQWLNLDWFANHPGGEYFDGLEGTRIYILNNYCESF